MRGSAAGWQMPGHPTIEMVGELWMRLEPNDFPWLPWLSLFIHPFSNPCARLCLLRVPAVAFFHGADALAGLLGVLVASGPGVLLLL